MTLKFFKLLQRNIEDDLNIIIPSNTDFLDELVEDCLPLLKGCVLIGACPSEQIAAIIFSFLCVGLSFFFYSISPFELPFFFHLFQLAYSHFLRYNNPKDDRI